MRLSYPAYTDAGLLLIRIGLAAVFIVHGLQKWQNLEATGEFFTGLGLPFIFVYIVAVVELIGGILVLFGWLARLSSLGLAIVMIMAITLVKWPMGFVGGYEFELALFLMALAITVSGPGKYRLRVINGSNNQVI
jgi:putative oxidoreductase